MLIDMSMQLPNGVDLLEYSAAVARERNYLLHGPKDQSDEYQHQYDVGPFGLLRWSRMEVSGPRPMKAKGPNESLLDYSMRRFPRGGF